MALIEYKFLPGIDKQSTTAGAENRWIDSDNVRFRYGLPEKVGGWSSLVSDRIVGVVRKQHSFVDLDGNRYVALGTDKFLLLYFEGQLHDITPIKSTIGSVAISCLDATFEVSLTFSSDHNLESGDIILLDNVTVPTGVGLTNAAFEDKLFQVTRVTSSKIAIVTGTQQTSSSGSGGSCSVIPYEKVGPAAQSYGYGFGIGNYGGTVSGVTTTTLNGALLADTAGTGGSGTAITLTSTSGFPTAGTIAVGNELITYTGISSNDLTGITRGANGTATAGTSNGQAHSDGSTVTNATNFSGFGSAVSASSVVLEPGLWSLDNFGQVLIATIANGKTFTWNAGAATPLTTRASTTTSGFATGSNPTASRVTLVSPTTRHLIHLGTETTIGDTTTQDDMFIRFSDQEDINDYAEKAIKTAGDFRLQDGTKIIVEIDGTAFWLSNNGFFMFDGTVKSLPCTVEDFVFNNFNTTKGQQVAAGLNNLFTEVTWYYPSNSSDFNDKYVVLNYGEKCWYTGTEARTSWMDATIYPRPYATKYDSTDFGTFPDVVGENGLGGTKYFEHEVGTDQVNEDGSTTTVSSFIKSYDIDLEQRQRNAQGRQVGLKLAGEIFLAMRRFVPDFKTLAGNAKVSLAVKRYPQQSDSTTTLSPFTINSSTTKKDTRARGRFVNVKIENDSNGEEWRFGTLRLDIQPDGRR